jgi:hypothetical protein
MDNAFLAANLGSIEKLKTKLLELEMLGSYREVPIAQIRHLFDGLVLEISKLEGENREIKKLIPKKEGVKNEPLPQGKQKGRGK